MRATDSPHPSDSPRAFDSPRASDFSRLPGSSFVPDPTRGFGDDSGGGRRNRGACGESIARIVTTESVLLVRPNNLIVRDTLLEI